MHQLIDKKNKIVIYIIFLFILSTINNKNLETGKNYSTIIDKIAISGLSPSVNLELTNKLNNFFYKNIFIVNKEEISKVILKYNIVEEYNVKKIYPSKLEINIRPTKLIARISGNKLLLVGSNGKLLTNEITDHTLPYIFGEFNSKEFLELKKNIDRSNFNFIDLKSISFYPSNRWDIKTANDILIKLPRNDILTSLTIAYKVVSSNKFINNKLIDLRVSNHLVIQ